MRRIIRTNNVEETIELGYKIAKLINDRSIITLNGDLGAGKTAFTKGIAKGLDIKKAISSPTFNILKVYNGRLPLYHMDAYRLEGLQQELGFEEFIEGDGVCVIEWADLIVEKLPKQRLNINIKYLDDNLREIELESCNGKYISLLEAL